MQDVTPDEGALVGKEMGRCRLVAYLGAGGMGCVYKGTHLALNMPRAVKVFPAPTGPHAVSLTARYAREAQQTARIDHPNIVRVFDFGVQDQFYFIEMEFVEGKDLASRIARQAPLDALDVADIGAQVADALNAAHAAGLVHRDIKPGNVLVSSSGRVKVADFGLAKSISEYGGDSGRAPVIGTAHYIPPEHWRGERMDGRSDIYSLGITLYHALTGTLPYRGRAGDLKRQHLEGPVPDPRELAPGIPSAMAEVVMRCMAKHPAKRYQSAAELAGELRAFLSAQESEAPAPTEAAQVSRGEPVPERPSGLSEPVAVQPAPQPRRASAPTGRTVAPLPGPSVTAPQKRSSRPFFHRPVVQWICLLLLLVGLILLILTSPGGSPREPSDNPEPAPAEPTPAGSPDNIPDPASGAGRGFPSMPAPVAVVRGGGRHVT